MKKYWCNQRNTYCDNLFSERKKRKGRLNYCLFSAQGHENGEKSSGIFQNVWEKVNVMKLLKFAFICFVKRKTKQKQINAYINGSTTGKNETDYSWHVPAMKFTGMKQWSKKLQIYFKNYDLCEYVEFGAISWTFDILSITAKFESITILLHMCDTYNCDYLQYITFLF